MGYRARMDRHPVTKILVRILILLTLITTGCSASPAMDEAGISNRTPTWPNIIAETPLPHSMKGYELYSWQTNDHWTFTLITGTNRAKSLDEIIAGENVVANEGWVKITVQGVEAIKTVLSQLPTGENIIWIGAPGSGPAPLEGGGITLPPREIVDSLQEYCQRLDLELQVIN